MNYVAKLFSPCLFIAAASLSLPQSFNVDVDINGSSPLGGSGAPSGTFGAAANQPGFWNALPAASPLPFALMGVAGQSTGVFVTVTGSGGTLGFNNPVNTGDFNLLLNDGERIGTNCEYAVLGLAPGQYRVFTYSVRPNGTAGTSRITVVGSLTSNPQVVSGTMPGNSFVLGRTHSIHDVITTDGEIRIHAAGTLNDFVNGFQIVSIPEPGSLAFAGFGFAAYFTRRRSKV